MSVYRPRGKTGFTSPFFQYDFQINGRRFHGSTERTTRREALEVERQKRHEAKSAGDDTTIEGGFARWWLEVGQHDSDSDTTFYRMERLQDGFTAILREDRKPFTLGSISDNHIAQYIARRRGAIGKHGKPLSPSSINRELQILRRIMRRAANVWHHAITMPAWGALLLEEPEEHIVDIPIGLEERVGARLREDFRPTYRFLLMTGLRTGSVLTTPDGHGPLRPEAVDFEAGVLTVKVKSKKPGGRTLRLPITRAMKLLLANEIGNHPEAVFTYVARTTRKGRIRGRRYPISQSAFYTALKQAFADENAAELRPHDLRHTAGNRTLAATGNLRLTQKLLGHTRVSTTQRYTHPDLDSLRDALERVHSPEISPEAKVNETVVA